MKGTTPTPSPQAAELRQFARQAFSRAAGAPLVPGNAVRLLKDAGENYPAWLEAIASAREKIWFESYIFADDHIGRRFAAALAERARAGAKVRVVYDWFGGLRKTSRRLVHSMRAAGVEVRVFNPFRFDSPFGWISRDHRKSIVIDGRVGYVTGLCVSAAWTGDPRRGVEPWRDTGIEIRGPAVSDLEEAFAGVWAACGTPLAPEDFTPPERIAPADNVALRVIATAPATAGMYRLDQMIASIARERLWLADAYFVGLNSYVQALRAAALDGVDVRLLVPGLSDVGLLTPISRAGYRPLLEAGVRVFEWRGSMMHAKTAVADGRWARIGSTNLNLASWMGNYELDVAIENEDCAHVMERMYEQDLEHATEIILGQEWTRRPLSRDGWYGPERRKRPRHRSRAGSASRAAAGALRISNAVGAAIANRRVLGPAEANVMMLAGLVLAPIAVLAAVWPEMIAAPIAALGGWIAAVLIVRAWRMRRAARKNQPSDGDQPPP